MLVRQLGQRRTLVGAVVLLLVLILVLLQISGGSEDQDQHPSLTRINSDGEVEPFHDHHLGGAKAQGDDRAKADSQGGSTATYGVTEESATTPADEAKSSVAPPKADDSPEAESKSQSPDAETSDLSKVIVMGKLQSEDTAWVNELSEWQNAVYCVDLEPGTNCSSGYQTKMNKAKEAMPYLTYIIDHYSKLPDIMAFVHAHQKGYPQAWHNDAKDHDAVIMLRELQLDTVKERGYVNLRCISEVGCPAEVQPFRDPPDPKNEIEIAFRYFYAAFFDATWQHMQEVIATVATPCCAQFAVTREQVQKQPLAMYVRMRKFLEETHYDDKVSGRVMEYMWHMVFGREAVHCDDMMECWCKVYGRCNLPPGSRGY